ncbi:MBL fold metallo-hydrolase [Teredinibacter haidensis]|uniref:MBL fold metallo-hydrolase n=1 Tax=Teredinibacter haidensis TaxID=2731755 RepID=UPI001FE7840D|nr:MBL fold metallo-hydrolase [Teredinibacter haidensis]
MVTASSEEAAGAEYSRAAHYNAGDGFKNTDPNFAENGKLFPILFRYVTEKRVDVAPRQKIPLSILSAEHLEQLPKDSDTVIRLGHSSVFLNIGGKKWLIDPVFSERASPFSFLGPKRFHPTPISLEDLPDIDGVLISHDHYDHLDEASIKSLARSVKHFIVPMGVDRHLLKWKVPAENIQVLDWWESAKIQNIQITATPAQHFSGRNMLDKNKTLWASYVIETPDNTLFFSGDSGYFSGFKDIGERFGPFALTMIEAGAYDKDWSSIHMTPEQSLQAHKDLGGAHMMPIHNGTFDLAFHSWYEPLQRISALAKQGGVSLLTPIMGQVITLNNIPTTLAWWEEDAGTVKQTLTQAEAL